MAVTASTFKVKFPVFASVNDAKLTPWIEEAQRNVCAAAWGSRADDGISYLAAHLYKCFGADEAGSGSFGFGPVTSKKVDMVSASYAVGPNFAREDMGSTKFGRRFISLRDLIFPDRCL